MSENEIDTIKTTYICPYCENKVERTESSYDQEYLYFNNNGIGIQNVKKLNAINHNDAASTQKSKRHKYRNGDMSYLVDMNSEVEKQYRNSDSRVCVAMLYCDECKKTSVILTGLGKQYANKTSSFPPLNYKTYPKGSVFEPLLEDYREACNNINISIKGSSIAFRQAIEKIFHNYYDYTNGRALKTYINWLDENSHNGNRKEFKDAKLNLQIKDYLQVIKEVVNKGAHSDDIQPNVNDLLKVKSLLERVIDLTYIRNYKNKQYKDKIKDLKNKFRNNK